MKDNIKLPPLHYDELPEPDDPIPAMHNYARKAIKADRQLRGETVDGKGFQSVPNQLVRLRPEELASLKSSGEDVSVGYPVAQYANARLIAAAPELLDALEGIMRVEARDRVMPVGAEWDAARAAIAKALGEKNDN